jgi:hypothetical protein
VTTDVSSFSVGDLHAPAADQEFIDDFPGENVGIGEVVGLLEAFVSEPEDVEVGFAVIEPLFVLFKPSPTLPLFHFLL